MILLLFTKGGFSVALVLTLLHSLWEGVGLSLITGLIMALTRKSRSSLRYHLLVGMLVLFAGIVFFTFLYELGPDTMPYEGQVKSAISGWFEAHAGVIAAGWAAVIAAKLLKLSFDLYALQRLKVVQVKALDPVLLRRVNILAGSLGVRRIIRVFESGIVKTPLVIGHLKPVILVPVWMISSITPEDLEAIVLHELAHIRRLDYLVNILLNIITTLLFFNPAVLWISSLIRAERENCCDDIVVQHTKEKIDYIRALVRFEERRSQASSYAPAFGGNGVLPRVERLIAGYNRTLNKIELIILTSLLVLGSLLIRLHPYSYVTWRTGPEVQAVPSEGARAAQAMEAKKKAEAEAQKH